MTAGASLKLPARCQKCGRAGAVPRRDTSGRKPIWCRCPKTGGPYQAPPGHVTAFIFESPPEAAFSELCRVTSNAERLARDDLSQRYVRCGSGYRELPRSSPKRCALEKRYAAALRALRRLQAKCSHPRRCIFNPLACGVCCVWLGS